MSEYWLGRKGRPFHNVLPLPLGAMRLTHTIPGRFGLGESGIDQGFCRELHTEIRHLGRGNEKDTIIPKIRVEGGEEGKEIG